METVTGSLRLLFLFDIAEEIDLAQLGAMLPPPAAAHSSLQHVHFENPPVSQPVDPVQLPTGERFTGRIRYYDYGVLSLEFDLPFVADWEHLIRLASHWIGAPGLEMLASDVAHRHAEAVRSALRKPYDHWLTEDYCVIHVVPSGEPAPSAEALLTHHGEDIARIVRGEVGPLSGEEQSEVLRSRLSYHPADLLVAGWSAAFLYDTAAGAAPTLQILEYANSQLLEFRHYDRLLAGLLKRVYEMLEERPGLLSRWRLAREAERVNRIRLEVRDLTEKTDNAIKFLSDMFSARLYRLAAAKVGVPDYRSLVDDQLRTLGDLYSFMVDQFHQARAFILELMIVIILIIDLYFLFAGKS